MQLIVRKLAVRNDNAYLVAFAGLPHGGAALGQTVWDVHLRVSPDEELAVKEDAITDDITAHASGQEKAHTHLLLHGQPQSRHNSLARQAVNKMAAGPPSAPACG